MSVTGATPAPSVSQAAAAAGTATGPAQFVVVQVLASYGGDSVRNGLVQTLQNAAGPGGVITGTITDVRADGTFALQTKAGPELLLHRPPELPLIVGSAVALRIVSVSPTPQVSILTVDGKLVSSQLTGPVSPPPAAAPTGPTSSPTPFPSIAAPAPAPAIPPATLASTLFAALSLEDEVAIESALSGDSTLSPLASPAASAPVTADAESVIATLVRPAPARLGSAPIPAGTRYLATLTVGGTEADAPPASLARGAGGATPAPLPGPDAASDDTATRADAVLDDATASAAAPAEEPSSPQAPAPAAAPAISTPPTSAPLTGTPLTDTPAPDTSTVGVPLPTTGAAAAQPPQQPPQPLDLSNFTALTTALAGRVLPTSTASETLVLTAIGTLSIPVQDAPPPVGAAVHLKITAVAPPETAPKPVAAPAARTDAPPAAPLLQDAALALAAAAPALAQQMQTQLSLPPSDQLAALIFNFLAGLKAGPAAAPSRWPDPPIRRALVDAGRSDLANRLDAEAAQIGKTQPAPPGQWSVTVLPFLGLAATKPMRLYRRSPEAEEREKGGGDRFVIELQLVRLGAMQFDGLVRERRFDLVLRSEQPLDEALRAGIERTFRDTLLISGWNGELSYARTGPVPLVALQPDGAGVGLSA